jgi:arsenate reductase
MKVFQYPRCSTCVKALRWLRSHDVEFQSVDIVQEPPRAEQLAEVLQLTGLPVAKLFNTSGVSYREGNFKARLQTMSESEALQALSLDGKLVKRPLLVGEGFALVGFSEANYQAHFATGDERRERT